MKTFLKLILPFLFAVLTSCSTEVQKPSSGASAKGKLFIIGGGSDESTAICVHGDSAKVYGSGQVIVLRHRNDTTRIWNGLLGGRNLEMDVLLPGEKFAVR